MRRELWRTSIFKGEARKEGPAKETKKQPSERCEENQVGAVCWKLRDKLAVRGAAKGFRCYRDRCGEHAKQAFGFPISKIIRTIVRSFYLDAGRKFFS